MDARYKDLETIQQVFEKYGVRFFLVYGGLLGLHRDGKFIEHDDDIDLAVIDPIDLKTRKAIGWALYDLGFKPQDIMFNVFGRMEPSEIGYNGDGETGIIVCQRNFKFTIFFFKKELCDQHGEEYVCIPRLGAVKLISTPMSFYSTPGVIKSKGFKFLTPTPIEKYLEFTYENWKDKNGRDHGLTYWLMHNKEDMVNLEGKNEAQLWK